MLLSFKWTWHLDQEMHSGFSQFIWVKKNMVSNQMTIGFAHAFYKTRHPSPTRAIYHIRISCRPHQLQLSNRFGHSLPCFSCRKDELKAKYSTLVASSKYRKILTLHSWTRKILLESWWILHTYILHSKEQDVFQISIESLKVLCQNITFQLEYWAAPIWNIQHFKHTFLAILVVARQKFPTLRA